MNGDLTARHTSRNDYRRTDRMNFLDAQRTYDYSFFNNRACNISLSTRHTFNYKHSEKYMARVSANGFYNKRKARSNDISATFTDEHDGLSMGALDTIFSGDPTKLQDLINRTRNKSLNSGHDLGGTVYIGGGIRIGEKTNDVLMLELNLNHQDKKAEVWRDYLINFGANPSPALHDNQYFDNSPNRSTSISGTLTYRLILSKTLNLSPAYRYNFTDRRSDSYAYRLDRLGE